MISYLVTVCNEYEEVRRLLEQLYNRIETGDDIVVLFDVDNGTEEVRNFLDEFEENVFVRIIKSRLNNNFAAFKNKGNKACRGNWIFQIDADEMPTDILLQTLPEMLEQNAHIDLIHVPRINLVDGLTKEHLDKWGWRVNVNEENMHIKNLKKDSAEYLLLKESGCILNEADNYDGKVAVTYNTLAVNFPDYQSRIYRNSPTIKWEGAVHERITGAVHYSYLPPEPNYCLLHSKTIERQEKQNAFYQNL